MRSQDANETFSDETSSGDLSVNTSGQRRTGEELRLMQSHEDSD